MATIQVGCPIKYGTIVLNGIKFPSAISNTIDDGYLNTISLTNMTKYMTKSTTMKYFVFISLVTVIYTPQDENGDTKHRKKWNNRNRPQLKPSACTIFRVWILKCSRAHRYISMRCIRSIATKCSQIL